MREDSTINERGWALESAVERKRKFPEFELPDEFLLQSLRAGSLVKLLFLFPVRKGSDETQCERMWVRISSIDGQSLVGALSNDPQSSTNLKLGDQVAFSKDHISAIYTG